MIRTWVDTILRQSGIYNPKCTDRFFVLCYTHALRNFQKHYKEEVREEDVRFQEQLVDSTQVMLTYLQTTLADFHC